MTQRICRQFRQFSDKGKVRHIIIPQSKQSQAVKPADIPHIADIISMKTQLPQSYRQISAELRTCNIIHIQDKRFKVRKR